MVRKTILGEDDPATSPRNSGWWALWTLQPYQKASEFLHDVNIDDPREIIWVGDGTFHMHNMTSGGELVQFILTARNQEEIGGDSWQTTLSAETLRDLYKGWPEHLKSAIEKVCLICTFITYWIPHGKGADDRECVQLLCQQPEQPAIYLWDHPHARTYVSGPICIM